MEPMLPPPPPTSQNPFGGHQLGGQPFGAPPGQAGPSGPTGSWGPSIGGPTGPWTSTPPVRVHGLATAALVCGLVGLVLFAFFAVLPILALVFGLISRSAITRSNGALAGAGRARAGWILGLVGIALFGVFGWAVATDRIGDGDTSVFELDEGSCVKELPDENEIVVTLPLVDCSEPHEAEVYLVVELNPDRSRAYPGDMAAAVETEEACLDAFEPFVGLDYQTSELDVFYLITDERAWRASRGEVTCLVFDPGNATLLSTLQNAGR